MHTFNNVEGNPFTEFELDTIQDYISITRTQITNQALKVNQYAGLHSSQGEFNKAFDALNQSAFYLNTAFRHAEYAQKLVQGEIEHGNETSSTREQQKQVNPGDENGYTPTDN